MICGEIRSRVLLSCCVLFCCVLLCFEGGVFV